MFEYRNEAETKTIKMSRITKNIAKVVASQLANPKKLEYEKLEEKLIDLTTKAIKKTIPKEVLDTYEKHPAFFKTHTSSNIICVGFNYEYYSFKKLPDNYLSPKIQQKEGEEILDMSHTVKFLKDDWLKLEKEIEIALIGLRTYNNVQKEFPEAFKLLPNIVTTSLAVDLGSIRCKIDKNNCK